MDGGAAFAARACARRKHRRGGGAQGARRSRGVYGGRAEGGRRRPDSVPAALQAGRRGADGRAAAHAGEDKQRRDAVETRNTADAAIFTAEKALRDGHNGYGPSAGILPAREAVADDFTARGGGQFGKFLQRIAQVATLPGFEFYSYEEDSFRPPVPGLDQCFQ